MPFTDRFQLLGLKRDEGACSFEAREIATGRPVLVHLFADRTSPLNRALLAKFDVLPASERSRIIDRGEHEGGVYIVTDRLAEYPGLHEWLRGKHADRAKPLDHGGAWQIKPPEPKLSVDDQWASLFPTAPRPVLEPSPASSSDRNSLRPALGICSRTSKSKVSAMAKSAKRGVRRRTARVRAWSQPPSMASMAPARKRTTAWRSSLVSK